MQKYEVKMEYVSDDECVCGLKKIYTIYQAFGGNSFTVKSCADCDRFDQKSEESLTYYLGNAGGLKSHYDECIFDYTGKCLRFGCKTEAA